MSKLIIPNLPGHHEGSGFEVDVTERQIIVRSSRDYDTSRHHEDRPVRPMPATQDDNKSLLSSLGKIGQAFAKK